MLTRGMKDKKEIKHQGMRSAVSDMENTLDKMKRLDTAEERLVHLKMH